MENLLARTESSQARLKHRFTKLAHTFSNLTIEDLQLANVKRRLDQDLKLEGLLLVTACHTLLYLQQLFILQYVPSGPPYLIPYRVKFLLLIQVRDMKSLLLLSRYHSNLVRFDSRVLLPGKDLGHEVTATVVDITEFCFYRDS